MKLRVTLAIGLVVLALVVLAAWQGAEAGRRPKEPALSEKAAAAIKKEFPDAEIAEVERERVGVMLYEVELEREGGEVEVTVTSDGQIVSIEREMDEDDLPEAVAKTLAEHAGDAKIEEVEAEEVRAELKFVPVAEPMIVYEVEFHHDGRGVELRIDANGKLLKEVEHEAHEDDEEDDPDDD